MCYTTDYITITYIVAHAVLKYYPLLFSINITGNHNSQTDILHVKHHNITSKGQFFVSLFTETLVFGFLIDFNYLKTLTTIFMDNSLLYKYSFNFLDIFEIILDIF